MSSDLRALIREVAADHPHAAPSEIARHVAKLTPADDLIDFYSEALTQICTQLLGHDRRQLMDGPCDDTTGSKSPNSSKLRERRTWWANLLASRVPVGEEWKQLGDCTVDDLQFCIDERRAHIAGVEKQINNFEHLIHLMEANGAQIARDLPPQSDWSAK